MHERIQSKEYFQNKLKVLDKSLHLFNFLTQLTLSPYTFDFSVYLRFGGMGTSLEFNRAIGVGWMRSGMLIWMPFITEFTYFNAYHNRMIYSRLTTAASESEKGIIN